MFPMNKYTIIYYYPLPADRCYVALLFTLQDCGASVKTAVCPAPVPTAERAPLCPLAASPAHVPQVTRAPAASMTRTNVPPRPPYVKTKDSASTPLVPTSELLFCFCFF